MLGPGTSHSLQRSSERNCEQVHVSVEECGLNFENWLVQKDMA